jgi:hypothetical protein
MNTTKYPKRLIEVDLPIKRISAHARREKSIRHGHISTLHIWWARRPLAACRAVICAALWPDPVDENCPQSFRDLAAEYITNFANKAATDEKLAKHCSTEVWSKWQVLAKPENQLDGNNIQHWNILRNMSMIFSNADTTSFEEDARLTAMWLWTLSTGSADNNNSESETDDEDDEETSSKTSKTGGYVLEFDAARKIAQGLGAHLEQLTRLVEVKGSTAKLLPVSERTQYLFGKEEAQTPSKTKGKKGKKKEPEQLNLFAVLGITETEEDTDWGEKTVPQLGNTTLDRIHQSMILFAAGRSEALKRFLVDEGAGNDQRFWGLAQALSALYPTGTDEKRWVDGVLARKKGLGF